MVPSHLGKPIAENLDPRHGDSDIAPVLRQSFILLAMFETFVDFEGQYWPCLMLLFLYFRQDTNGRLGTPIGGHLV